MAWRHLAERRADEAITQFLAAHWQQPIAPQGPAPATHTPAETSLAPEACGVCHPALLADWSTSLHSRAVGPGILWQLRTMDQGNGNDCLRCHAPLAEQKALVALERGWPGAPSSAPPEWVPPDLHRRGLVCAACHVRRHQRYGPPSNAAPIPASERRPHGGFVPEAAFSDSRFCSTCHQFGPDGRQANGKLLENTYEEWRASAYAREGRPCQSCHMPDRRHLWRGVHDRDMVRSGLHRELTLTLVEPGRLRISVVLENRGAGHHLPTYVVPKIYVNVYLRSRGTQMLVGQHVIGRSLDLSLERELADTRLPAGGRRELAYDVSIPAGVSQAILRTEVAPGEHYERMFADMARRNPGLDATTRELLERSIANASAARYWLDDLAAAAPQAPGAQTRAVAN